MSITEKTAAIGAYLAALGVQSERAAYCLPILAGDKPVPGATEAALAESSAAIADGITMTLVEAAKRKGVSRSTIWRMTKDGTLSTVNVRGKNRIRLGDLERAFSPTKTGRAA